MLLKLFPYVVCCSLPVMKLYYTSYHTLFIDGKTNVTTMKGSIPLTLFKVNVASWIIAKTFVLELVNGVIYLVWFLKLSVLKLDAMCLICYNCWIFKPATVYKKQFKQISAWKSTALVVYLSNSWYLAIMLGNKI